MAKTVETQIAKFKTSEEAWRFMRACDAANIKAGFPSLTPDADGYYAVAFIGTYGEE
jgi:hypothetical protein